PLTTDHGLSTDCSRFPLRSLRVAREPSSPFCPPLSAVRRQFSWRSWWTSGPSNRLVSAYDRLCPALAAGARQNKRRSWWIESAFVRRWPARASCPTAARPAPWCSTVGYSASSARGFEHGQGQDFLAGCHGRTITGMSTGMAIADDSAAIWQRVMYFYDEHSSCASVALLTLR